MNQMSSTEFQKKCEEVIPKIEEKLDEKVPNVKSVTQFFELQNSQRLNLSIDFTTSDDQTRTIALRIPAKHVIEEDLDPIVNEISSAISQIS